MAANYLADVLLLSPMLIGSLGVLGNPTAMISRILNVFRARDGGDTDGYSSFGDAAGSVAIIDRHSSAHASVQPGDADVGGGDGAGISGLRAPGGRHVPAAAVVARKPPSIWESGFFLSRLTSMGRRVVSELSHGAVESVVSASSVSWRACRVARNS